METHIFDNTALDANIENAVNWHQKEILTRCGIVEIWYWCNRCECYHQEKDCPNESKQDTKLV